MKGTNNININKSALYNTAFVLALITVFYNIAEGIVSIWLGYADESLALFGFGTDSFVEVISGLGIAHMVFRIKKNSEDLTDSFEKKALRITGIAFYILTAGLSVSGVYNIIIRHRPETTFWGIVISAVSIITMTLLVAAKQKTGRKLKSDAILADAECTKVCIYMSIVLLISSGIYELTGFTYIDSIGALGLAWLSFREGKECFFKVRNNGVCEHCGK